MRFEIHQVSGNWDTTHDSTIARFDRLSQAEIAAQALADYHDISFSAFYVLNTETDKRIDIKRSR